MATLVDTRAIARAQFGESRYKGANIAMEDGSVRFLPESIDQAILRALITKAGGEVIRPVRALWIILDRNRLNSGERRTAHPIPTILSRLLMPDRVSAAP